MFNSVFLPYHSGLLDNPPVQNYRSKSKTAIIIAGCLNFRCLQFFSPFQFPHFGFLICFAVSSGFFAVSLLFFAVSKPANICNMRKMMKHAKSVRRQKRMPPAIIPEKAIILHTLEDAGYIWHVPETSPEVLKAQLLHPSICDLLLRLSSSPQLSKSARSSTAEVGKMLMEMLGFAHGNLPIYIYIYI